MKTLRTNKTRLLAELIKQKATLIHCDSNKQLQDECYTYYRKGKWYTILYWQGNLVSVSTARIDHYLYNWLLPR